MKVLEEDQQEDLRQVPEHYKEYHTGERFVHFEKAQRSKKGGPNRSYDGPTEVKEINLAKPGEDPKPVYVGKDLSRQEESELIALLREYEDCLGWKYSDMKGVPPEVVKHTIPITDGARPVRQRAYPMNSKYSQLVKEEIDKLLEVGFIYEIEHTEWVSPIVIVLKKN
ncbi:hypothetical protein [Escherichia coli]|uniref:hypothetical protein n=1 Tax=Escherichia coli TaxID=562 RepID=UPI002576B3D7|nr:hypothetical protein [Escherichia coli]MDM1593495.1 hypothetical protein [Escherichia coli]